MYALRWRQNLLDYYLLAPRPRPTELRSLGVAARKWRLTASAAQFWVPQFEIASPQPTCRVSRLTPGDIETEDIGANRALDHAGRQLRAGRTAWVAGEKKRDRNVLVALLETRGWPRQGKTLAGDVNGVYWRAGKSRREIYSGPKHRCGAEEEHSRWAQLAARDLETDGGKITVGQAGNLVSRAARRRGADRFWRSARRFRAKPGGGGH